MDYIVIISYKINPVVLKRTKYAINGTLKYWINVFLTIIFLADRNGSFE